MANDHFVAQTYLKHFGDDSRGGILHGYQKSTGRNFPCWPYDVCREWEGDLNPLLIKPALLGDFRKLFEPRWDAALAAMHSKELGAEDRFAISGYFANLMVCTPAWRRLAVSMYNDHAKSFLIFSKQMKEKYGGNPDLPVEAIEMLERGEIRLNHDPNYIKAVITRQLMDFAWVTYHSDWTIIRNSTGFPFITSDNPVAVRQSGDLRVPMTRDLPITPGLCLSTRRLPPIDASMAPMGRVNWSQATAQGAKSINRLVAQCAEELVISTAHSVGIESLVRNCARFRVDADFVKLPSTQPDAVYDGTIIRVREVR